MRKDLSIIISLLIALVHPTTGEGTLSMNSPLAEVDKKFPGIELLPPGSILREVSLPRYHDHKLRLLVTAPKFKVESQIELSGQHINTYIYDLQGNQTTTLYMAAASYFFDTGLLVSKGKVLMQDIRVNMQGENAVFDKNSEVGIIRGPVVTVLHNLRAARKNQ